jgi:segregation and condensation protein A
MTVENEKLKNNDDYLVDLEVFQGPLDLLLYLINKEEVDIYDIPIARITRQYLKYIEMMTTLNLELAGEFILMAASLIRIKARLLLPHEPGETEELDPREELMNALIQYKKYKEAGEILRENAIREEQNYVPDNPVKKIEGKVELEPVTTVFDLIAAFKDVLSNQKDETYHEVELEEVSIEDRIRFILTYLQAKEFATFQELFNDIPRKMVAVVTFIALLELSRSKRIVIYQSLPFSEMRIYRGEMFDDDTSEIDIVDITALKLDTEE